PLPRRGFTRNDGTGTVGYSRLTDGDLNTFWKSNPYLTKGFTSEDDSMHPQWVTLDLATTQPIDAIRIAWADPYARRYLVQYWTGDDPIKQPTKGTWLVPGIDRRAQRSSLILIRRVPRSVVKVASRCSRSDKQFAN